MDPSKVFSAVSAMAALQWLLLIALPKWKVTHWLTSTAAVPLLLSVVYFIYIIGFFNIDRKSVV